MLSLLITSCILSGILGRLGGWEHGNRLFRILGIPTILCIEAYILLLTNNLPINILCLVITFGLLCASISTYWDFIPYWIDKDNFYAHGFVIGLSLTPIAYTTGHWLGFGCSVALYTLWMGLWSKFTHWDVLEEFGRYAVIPIGVWLLLK